MEPPLDLFGASREELIALVRRQREQIADLEQRLGRQAADLANQRATIRQLTERVGVLLATLEVAGDEPPSRPSGMPGLKSTPGRTPPAAPPSPRKRRARGAGRKRMRPTARQVPALGACPHCGTALRGGTVKRTREVLEVVPTRSW